MRRFTIDRSRGHSGVILGVCGSLGCRTSSPKVGVGGGPNLCLSVNYEKPDDFPDPSRYFGQARSISDLQGAREAPPPDSGQAMDVSLDDVLSPVCGIQCGGRGVDDDGEFDVDQPAVGLLGAAELARAAACSTRLSILAIVGPL